MHLIKRLILCSLIALLNTVVGAEVQGNDIVSDQHSTIPAQMTTTPLPIVLQLTNQNSSPHETIHVTSIETQSAEESDEIKDVNNFEPHKITQNEVEHNKFDKQHNTPNDVEVFDNKPSPSKQNQEEEENEGENEAVGEEEAAEAEGEEAEAVPESEPEAQQEPAAEAEPEVVAEEESKPEAGPEPEPEPEPEAEAEPEPEPEPETEPEPVAESALPSDPVPEETAAAEPVNEETADADPASQSPSENNEEPQTPSDEEMQKDEPPKENNEGDKEAQEATPAVVSPTGYPAKTCYTCNSHEDIACSTKPTEQMNCKSADDDPSRGHGGCYTIFKAEANMTMRGCVDELAEQGLRDCLAEKNKSCTLCYSNGCNDKMSPNVGTKPLMDFTALIIFNIIGYGLMKYL